ncbi:MAG: hypothetical protein ABL862_01575 [Candidatus Nitrotoga sp.]
MADRIDPQVGSHIMAAIKSGDTKPELLLHSHKGATSQGLMRVSKEGSRVLSCEALVTKRYPRVPSKPFYLVYNVEPEGFEGYEWDTRSLPERLQNRQSAESRRRSC